MNFKEWIEGLPGEPLVTQAAERAGIDRSTISRQLKRGVISAENVIALARAHGKNEVDALVETGYVTAEAASHAGVPQALGYATARQLLDEIRARVDPESVRLLRGGGDPTVITPKFGQRPAAPPEARWAARDLGEPSEKELFDAAQDAAAEAPDPEGPETGA
ncbi:MAG: helix-turn-helix transcriptional regulator [Gordonia sp. (in: high G+C Gram-positive bacteria)]